MTRDSEFLALYADGLIVDTIDSNEIAFLLKRGADHFAKYGAPLTREALVMMLAAPQLAGVKLDHEVVLHYYDNAPEPSESVRAYLYDHAKTWFQTRAMQNVMDHASALLDEGQVADARDLMARSAIEIGGIGDNDYGVEIISDFEAFAEEL